MAQTQYEKKTPTEGKSYELEKTKQELSDT